MPAHGDGSVNASYTPSHGLDFMGFCEEIVISVVNGIHENFSV